jgi:Ca2+-binding RTX toxin-like protein
MPTVFVSTISNNAMQNTATIKAALAEAGNLYLANPSAGQVKVQFAAGTWVVTADKNNPSAGAIELPSGVELAGSGTRATVIKLADGFNARTNGIVRTELGTVENVTLSNLVIDGNRANNTGHQAGFICGIKEDGTGRTQKNIVIDGVEVRNCTAYGINPHEKTYNMVIRNSVAHSNGLDGFVADAVIGGVYANNHAYGNDRHGFNIQNETKHLILKDNEAHDNGYRYMFNGELVGGAGITIQRGNIPPMGSTAIPWVSDIQITGGSYHNNGKEGLLVKLSERITVTDVDIYGNLRQGIRIEGSKDVTVENSQIFNNSQEFSGRYDEINIRLRFDDDYSRQTYPSLNTRIINNEIYSTAALKARFGVREEPTNDDGGATNTILLGNTIYGAVSGAIATPVQRWIGTAAANAHRGTWYDEDLNGKSGNDTLWGLGGNDHLRGDAGKDRLFGGHGNDWLFGGAGNDQLSGGRGNDTLSGDLGRDAFVFNSRLGTSTTDRKVNFDTVVQYSARDDSVWLDNAIFRKIGSGSLTRPVKLDADFFNAGNRRKDADDYILYNKKTGILSYDSDGSGSHKPVEFAQFKKGLALGYNEFFVV